MTTRVLCDIHNDLKRLITVLTSFKEDEEGFRICERFCLSNIKHHRYLSIDSHVTKEAINAVITKFTIHGKYEVAKKFQELIDSFLSSFDFEQHPQYDLQWYLLTFLLDLSTETHKSNLDSLKLTRGEHSFNAATGNEDSITEEIDWAQYLKEDQENFFCDYKSDDSESEWSDLTEEEGTDENDISLSTQICNTQLDIVQPSKVSDSTTDKFSLALIQNLESRKWLLSNVQTDWWNNLKCQKYSIIKQSCDTSICDIWHETSSSALYSKVVTLSEYQVCRELLWMFYVQTSMVVFQQDSESKFSICSDISIPSLTTTAFKSILTPFCEYFSMICDIERFGTDLQPTYNQDLELQNPPLTYEAYNAALKQYLCEFKTEVVNIEKDIMKQENCNTFLSLSANLRKHLNTIKMLYDIHQNVIIDWKVSPNWKCASQLLSSLFYEMQNSYSRERTNICINLYLSSLTAYLNIIDTWLSEGRLEDWRDEFIIMRVKEDENEQIEKFTIRLSDNICLTDPIMQFLLQKVKHMGHSIELLVSLDRITDIWRMDNEYNDIRISLNVELQNKLLSEISKYSPVEETDTVQIDKVLLQEYDADIEKNIIQQLSTLHNPFFMKAMEDYIPYELYKNDMVDARVHDTHNSKTKPGQLHNLYKKLQKIKYIFPMQNILENTLSEILILRYNSASKLVKNIMIEEYKLHTHLKLLRFVYMMEAGHVMNKFYEILFYEIENNQMWANSYFLSCILEEVFSQYWPDTSSRWSITVHSNISIHQVLQAVESITLHYTVEWPISIVLTKKVLEKYNEIFRFQLKLKWALWTLNNLRFSDLEDSRSPCIRDRLEQFHVRRLESLRFWLLHAIGSIHTYLSGQVLQSLGFILEKVLAQANSLDTIISVHNEYLNKVYEHCLLTEDFEDLMTTINNMIEMCNHIRDRWSRKKLLLASTELDVMEHNYIKYHTYLALALHNAVQHKDADYLTALSSAFNCSMPCA